MGNSIVEILQKYNRITVILISILTSLAIVYLSLFITFAIYFIPVAAFLVMHYLKFYRFLPRLAASLVISFIAILLMSGIYANQIYTSNGVESGSTGTGLNITASVTPFNHAASDYNFSFVLSGNTSIGEGYYIVIQGMENSYSANYSSEIVSINDSNGNRTLYVHDTNLPSSGVYGYSLHLANGTRLVNSIGPVFSVYALFVPLLLSLGPSFLITFELVFLVGLFVARSFSNSMRYRNPPKTPPPDSFQGEAEETQEK